VTVSSKTLHVQTKGRGLYDVTRAVEEAVQASGVKSGLCSVFVAHTSASLVTQENADPSVLRDLERWMARIAPESHDYEHDAEGPDDMPSHIRASITKTSETVPIQGGAIALGTWQAIYVWEHRTASHDRKLIVTVVGE
jgi:secondary thiamine-phosphate synthase enzyme